MAKRSSLYSLLFTLFNDAIGWGIVLTIFAPLLFDTNSGILPKETSYATRNILVGFLISSFAITQFFSMPFIGSLSDHFGRKKTLLWTVGGAMGAFVLSAVAVIIESLVLLFVARLLAGLFSGNAGTAQASIADLSTEKNKAKNLSLSGIVGGISWIVGPPLGGILSTQKLVSWFDYATPFWFLALLFLVNWLWIYQSYEETFEKKERHDWKQEIKNLAKLSKLPRMKGWLIVAIFFFFGDFSYILYYPTLSVQKFGFTQEEIGLFSGYLAIFWIAGSTLLNRWLGEKVSPEKVLLATFPLSGLFLWIGTIWGNLTGWIVVFPFLNLLLSIGWVEVMALASNLAGKENQGKIFGILQSLTSLALLISPICSGVIATYRLDAPFYLGVIVFFAITFFVLGLYMRERKLS